MPSPRMLLRVLLTFALVAVWLPVARPAAALDAATFVAKTSAWAQEEERAYGVPASVAMAQAILESGWGESSLTKNAKNWFGIKCSSTLSPHQNGCYSVSTTEYDSSGNAYTTTAQFRKYDTDQNSFIDHGYFLSRLTRYAKAFNYTNNPDRFIVEVHLGGYATDPQYANKIINLMVKYDLYQYNVTAPATGASELVIRPQTQAKVGATAYVTGLLSPGGAGSEVLTQVYTASGWSIDELVTAGTRGQFSIPLTFGTATVGTTRYRVQATSAAGTLTSAEFTVDRLGSVTVQSVTGVLVGQTARLKGQALGYGGRTITSQVLVNGAWQNHTTATVNSDGSFDLPLTYGQASAGTRTFRARLVTAAGATLVSSQVTATWAATAYPTIEQRIGGADRYEVAANVSSQLPAAVGSSVVVASGEVFTDALSAGPLAAYRGARLLLTRGASLPSSVTAELTRSRPSEIVIVGGPGTVSDAVLADLQKFGKVTRIGGADRYAVSADLAARIPGKHVVIASGELFSDALSAGPLAAELGGPLLLVRSGELPSATARALSSIAPERVTVLGGAATVSDAVLTEIASITGAPTNRVGGADRFEVAANVAKQFFASSDTAVVASGLLFPDGLSGTPLAHSNNAPILLSTATCTPSYTTAVLNSLKPASTFLVGGSASVTSPTVQC
ncbi:cell wall-binding repeat-containing protein [Tessaracoccus sp. Z1128]